MADKVAIKFQPNVQPPAGYLPMIDMRDPFDPSKRVTAYPRREADGSMFFDLDVHVAAQVLALDAHLYKLWSPSKLTIAVPTGHGQMELVDLVSIDPAAKPGEAVVADAGKAAEDSKKAEKVAAKAKEKGKALVSPAPAIDAAEIGDEVASVLDGLPDFSSEG